jgi:hypothetical protein
MPESALCLLWFSRTTSSTFVKPAVVVVPPAPVLPVDGSEDAGDGPEDAGDAETGADREGDEDVVDEASEGPAGVPAHALSDTARAATRPSATRTVRGVIVPTLLSGPSMPRAPSWRWHQRFDVCPAPPLLH